jgi:hypothetical protein
MMIKRRALSALLTITLVAILAFVVGKSYNLPAEPVSAQGTHQASLQKFTFNEMVDRAGRIFRGTVVSAEPGALNVGGASLPTVNYRFRVDQVFRGDFESKDGVYYAEVMMLGTPKGTERVGGSVKLNSMPAPTLLTVGSDHLMLLTPESSVGLTAPVGLGQGSFEIFEQDKIEFAKNEFNNAGIFDGPVRYERIAAEIRTKGGKR